MSYIAYIYRADHDVPHMEVLSTEDRSTARVRAFELLRRHARPLHCELWRDDVLLERLTPPARCAEQTGAIAGS